MPTEGQATEPVQPTIESAVPPSAHLVGVCGTGMKALAELLDGLGWRLSGSDLQAPGDAIEALCDRGFKFLQGHDATNVPLDVQNLIFSPAIQSHNAERMEGARRGIPEWSYGQMIGRLMSSRTGIGIAGTHGKSTTTAMVGWIMTATGHDPAVLVGAELCDTGRSGRAGSGGLLIVESCEFDQSFLDFQPGHAAILNVEPDHFDCYADLESLIDAFRQFACQVPAQGVLLINGDCSSAVRAAAAAPARVVTFGMQPQSNWRAEKWTEHPDGIQFDVSHRGKLWGRIALKLHGEHNVQNALAAAALCAELGVSRDDIVAGLRSFGGIKRRFEVVGEFKGVLRIHDYAHHPTAVRATLQTARQVYGSRRIWCAFQPHQVSRTAALMDDFATSFDAADEVLIAPVFAAREQVTNEPHQVARELATRIAARGTSARYCESLDQIITTVDDATRPGDVLIAMGAGDIDRIHHEFTRRVRRDRQA